jgi:hypothetical protein
MPKSRSISWLAIALVAVTHTADALDIDAQGGLLKYKDQIKNASEILVEAIRKQRFELLGQIQSGSGYVLWHSCGSSDIGPESVSFKSLEEILISNSNESHIVVNPLAEQETLSPGGVIHTVIIETENWSGSWKYVRFFLELEETTKRWALSRACFSPTPILSMTDDNVLRKNVEYIDHRLRKFIAVKKCGDAELFLSEMGKRFPDLLSKRNDHIYNPWWLLVSKCNAVERNR